MRDTAGIVLEPDKEYLVQARLNPLARLEGCDSVGELIGRLHQPGGTLRQRVTEAMTTNETQFFRDGHPFECLRQVVLPKLIARRGKERTLNIWCAAAATGQEPYSLAMLLHDYFPQLSGWACNFLASDFSAQVIAQAQRGTYTPIEVGRGLPPKTLERHFRRDADKWQLSEAVRSKVEFRVSNLIGAWSPMPKMDLILLRNVMIYFDQKTKDRLLDRMCQALRPGGAIFFGASEALIPPPRQLQQHRSGKTVYYLLAE
jgi:chemotaxis protein methyltransferase CheR